MGGGSRRLGRLRHDRLLWILSRALFRCISARWTFFNTLTGVRRDEDPGGAPYIDERGHRHWLSADGEWQDDPGPGPVNIVSGGCRTSRQYFPGLYACRWPYLHGGGGLRRV